MRCFRAVLATWPAALTIIILLMNVHADSSGYVPPEGFVPDGATAVAIAEAVLIPIYGRAQVQAQMPLLPKLNGNEWTVTGQLGKGMVGGVATIVIDKMTGRIIRVTHGR